MLESLRLDGKTEVVTGAGRGLGQAMAKALAQAGAEVVCATALWLSGTGVGCVTGQIFPLDGGGLT